MQIKSKFFDYYDSVGVGSKEGPVYARATSEVKLEGFPLKERRTFFHKKDDEIPLPDGDCPNWYSSHVLVFAGKIYPYLRYNQMVLWDIDSTVKYFKEDFEKSKSLIYKDFEHFEDMFTFKGSDRAENWAIQNKIVVASSEHEESYSRRICTFETFTLNPLLKDLQFQKCLDPYTAYQELDMWVSGTLPNNTDMPEIADKHKIQQHGFDEWSFRKLPQGK